MYVPDQSNEGVPPPPPGRESARNARYSYLVGRLHNRQMTMEEATELFTIMQGMIQTSEAARVALMRASATPPPATRPPPPAERPPTAGLGVGDDVLLVGLLMMGAGAGLLAAMTKRIQDVTTPSTTASPSQSDSETSSRPG